jgi:hypothetical protein
MFIVKKLSQQTLAVEIKVARVQHDGSDSNVWMEPGRSWR